MGFWNQNSEQKWTILDGCYRTLSLTVTMAHPFFEGGSRETVTFEENERVAMVSAYRRRDDSSLRRKGQNSNDLTILSLGLAAWAKEQNQGLT